MLDMTAALANARAVTDPAAQVGAITGLMAGAMIEMAAGYGSATVAHLADAGFTAAEIAEFGPAAVKLAAERSIRTVERHEMRGPAETYDAIKALYEAADRHGVGLDRDGARVMKRGLWALDNLRLVFDLAA